CVAHVTFTNLKCNATDRNIGEFDYCYIKAVNRTHKYVSVYFKLYQRPLSNITLNIKVFRKSNGYQPFIPTINIDLCKFLINQKHPFMIIFYKITKQYSNINHTCPYITDVYVDKMYTGNLESDFMRYIPIPEGDYLIRLEFQYNKAEYLNISLYSKVLK
ncbi:GH15853, partial [Drosophila grimshawi]